MKNGMARWSWIGACATGTSHARDEALCDDAGACLELATQSGPVLVVVASDGAGSASLSRLGSAIVTRSLCRSAAAFLRAGKAVSAIDEDVARDWLDEIRDRIGRQAVAVGEPRKSFAATMVAAVVGLEGAVVVHVGDGSCAMRLAGSSTWQVPSWPAGGEYAATTYFVTDDPEPRVTVSRLDGQIEEVAVFTDGMERLALDFTTRSAFDRFFESVFPALRGQKAPGRARRLSAQLRDFLDSERVTDRTDDDKTLVMARLLPNGQSTAHRHPYAR